MGQAQLEVFVVGDRLLHLHWLLESPRKESKHGGNHGDFNGGFYQEFLNLETNGSLVAAGCRCSQYGNIRQ